MAMNSSRAAAIYTGTAVAWRAAGLFLAAIALVFAARYLINDAAPFLTDFSPEKLEFGC